MFCADDVTSRKSSAASMLSYDTKSQSDTVRLTRHVRVAGFVVCPVSEFKVVLLLTDGRFLVWQLVPIDQVQTTLSLKTLS